VDVFKDDLLEKLIFLHNRGYFECYGDVVTRNCPPKADTHIGRTFEYLLEVPMNNFQSPDYKGIELKSHKLLSSSNITLFANNPHYLFEETWIRGKTTKEFYKWYQRVCGTPEGEFLNNTVKYKHPNSQGLYLDLSDDLQKLQLCDEDGQPCLEWDLNILDEQLYKKFSEGAFLFCKTKTNAVGREMFHIVKVTHVEYDGEKFQNLIANSLIEVDILFKKKKNLRQTSFRANKKNLEEIFDTYKEYDLVKMTQ